MKKENDQYRAGSPDGFKHGRVQGGAKTDAATSGAAADTKAADTTAADTSAADTKRRTPGGQ